LAAKWVFLEWFAQVWQAGAAVETLWKLFFAKMRRFKLKNQKISIFARPTLNLLIIGSLRDL